MLKNAALLLRLLVCLVSTVRCVYTWYVYVGVPSPSSGLIADVALTLHTGKLMLLRIIARWWVLPFALFGDQIGVEQPLSLQ